MAMKLHFIVIEWISKWFYFGFAYSIEMCPPLLCRQFAKLVGHNSCVAVCFERVCVVLALASILQIEMCTEFYLMLCRCRNELHFSIEVISVLKSKRTRSGESEKKTQSPSNEFYFHRD